MATLSNPRDVRIHISGRHVDLGEALQAKAQNALQSVAEKYFDGPGEIRVVFSKANIGFACSIHMHADQTGHFEGSAEHANAYGALEGAVERVGKQARRKKRATREDKRRTTIREMEGVVHA